MHFDLDILCVCDFFFRFRLVGKLHWRRCFNYAIGTSFGGYEIGTSSSAMWMKRIKLKRSTRLHAILMKMPNFVNGIDAPHAMNTSGVPQ